MIENATNLTSTTGLVDILEGFFAGLSPVIKTVLIFLFGFLSGSGVIAVGLNFFFKNKLQKAQQDYEEKLRQRDIQNAIEQTKYILKDFASSWETLKNESVNLEYKSIPVLQKGENIKTIATSVSSKLPDSYVGEALDIANQLIYLKGEVERQRRSGVSARGPFHKKDEIDQLAERAKECALKMGGKEDE